MPFKSTTFGEFLSIQRGHDLPQDSRAEGNVPVAGASGIVGYHNKSKGVIPGITIGRSGSIGEVKYYSGAYFPLNTALYVTDFRGNDPRFAYYFLKNFDFTNFDSGSVQPSLNRNFLNPAPIEIPDPQTQKSIAHILGTLDDKIELNQKMNQTLEEIAKAIFKSWFVHFDPVRAKAEGRPTGLPADISDLFPDNLVDSEIGEIPAGWSLKTIGDIADCVGGGTPSTKSPEFWDNGIHAWTTPKDLSNSRSIHLMQTDRKITDLGLKKISSGLLPTGTVLLSSRAPVGYLALATEPTAINQGYIALRPKGTVSNYYLLHWCDTNLSEIKSRASGTTFAEISKASFRPIPALAPHDDVMSAFHRIVSPIYERVHISSKETQLLEDLRDTLLPKLISGELRIPDAKKFLEEAGI